MTTSPIAEIIVSLLILNGAIFATIGSLGLLKMPDFFTRLHGPTKATTLGSGSILVASMVYFSFVKGEPSVHEFLVTMFLFMTAPIGALLMSKAALKAGLAESTGQVREKTTDLSTVERPQ